VLLFQNINDLQWEKIKDVPLAVELTKGELKLSNDWRILGTLMHLSKESQIEFQVRVFGMRKEGLWAVVNGRFSSNGFGCPCLVFPYAKPTDSL
jgi:hypothetical protein